MKKKVPVLIIAMSILTVCNGYSQSQLLFTRSGKNCALNVTTDKISDNFINATVQVNWINQKLENIKDTSSLLCIEKDRFIADLPGYVRLVSHASSKYIAFNSAATLKLEIDEMFSGGEVSIRFPFYYLPGIPALGDPASRQEFTFKRPTDYALTFNLTPDLIVHKIPPKLVVLAPEGVEEGFKPIVDTNSLRIRLLATDAAGVERVVVNNIQAEKVNDSVYVADVPLRIGFENSISATAVDKFGLSSKKQFAVESRKSEVKIVALSSILPSMSRKPSDVDLDIPDSVVIKDPNKFALIIGNEDYSTFQTSLKTESNVVYAIHDAKTFKEYLQKIIGVPDENIIMVLNAKAMEMHRAIGQINTITKNMNGNAILYVFYAGHGFPDEITKEPYLIPVDVNGTDLQFAIKQNDFFRKLTEFPSKQVIVFIDACFSGGGRNQGLIAARGIKIKPRENTLTGNLVVISASSGEQSSLPYEEKQHGLFTYFLLKKLKETTGEIKLSDLSDYLTTEVGVRSVMVNNKEQNPQTNVSFDLGDRWKEWRMK